MKNKKYLLAAAALASAIMFGAESCESESDPSVESDSSQSYASGSKVESDTNAYLIKGEVVGPVNETTRQVTPGQGDIFGYNGYLNGSFTGPVEKGKGFVRIRVESASPSTDLAPVGQVTIVKTSDTKAKALMNGDVVSFKCRRQYEAVAAVRNNQKFDKKSDGTWELDYCRLATPVIVVK